MFEKEKKKRSGRMRSGKDMQKKRKEKKVNKGKKGQKLKGFS
jgi:hypothetical protein